jgi:CDP-paratose 2-epimerase
MSKNILITGGCGFVGSSLAIELKAKYPSYTIYALDNLKRRGSELNISRLSEHGIIYVHGDIRCKEDTGQFKDLDAIIDAAAEPSVMAGLNESPDYLIHTNLNGTINCLDLARKNNADFIFLSTSRVYPIKNLENINYEETSSRFALAKQQSIAGVSEHGISEDFSLSGARSLYGATKLASELLITEYNEMLGVKTVINRCGVISGPFQMGKVDQGVVVLWAARHFWKRELSYIGYGGEGKQLRDILHVKDLFDLVDIQLHNMDKVNGKTYNVGGGNPFSASLMELTKICEEVTGNKILIHKVKETRQADIRIYVTDNTVVEKALGWKAQRSPARIIQEVHDWIRANEKQLKPILY